MELKQPGSTHPIEDGVETGVLGTTGEPTRNAILV